MSFEVEVIEAELTKISEALVKTNGEKADLENKVAAALARIAKWRKSR